MQLNGHNQTIVGHMFDPNNFQTLPSFTHSWNLERRTAWAEGQTKRYAISETCQKCKRPLIAEEAMAHKLNHAPFYIRSLARSLAALSQQHRKELLTFMQELYK